MFLKLLQCFQNMNEAYPLPEFLEFVFFLEFVSLYFFGKKYTAFRTN